MGTRSIAEQYMGLLCSGEFEAAFAMLSENVVYRIAGRSDVSAPMHGREAVLKTLIGVFDSFLEPLEIVLRDIIVEGNKAVCLASGKAVSASGQPYIQSDYAMILHIENDEIQSVLEFMDLIEVETKILSKRLVI